MPGRRNGSGITHRVLVACVLSLTLCLNQAVAQTDVGDDPAAVVNSLHHVLADVANHSGSTDFETRFHELQPIIDATYSFRVIAHLAGRTFWKELTEEQQDRFVDAFRRANIAAYAARFTSDGGLSFDQAVVNGNLGKRIMVRSHLLRGDGTQATFDYVLQETDGHWHIVMVLVDGVSELALKRSQLTSVYEDSGYQGVMDYLEKEARGDGQ